MATYSFFRNLLVRIPRLPIAVVDNTAAQISEDVVADALSHANPGLFGSTSTDATFKSLVKDRYLHRMATRCTPFGLFAGTAVMSWGDHTSIQLDSDYIDSRIRLDMSVIAALEPIFRKCTSRKHLLLAVNNTLYDHNGQLNYVERKIASDLSAPPTYAIAIMEGPDQLKSFISSMGSDFHPASEVIRRAKLVGLTERQVWQLVDDQLLHTQFVRYLDSRLALEDLLHTLKKGNRGTVLYTELSNLNNLLLQYTRSPGGAVLDSIRKAIRQILPEHPAKRMVQIDYSPRLAKRSLDNHLQSALQKGMRILQQINTAPVQNSRLETFKKRFRSKYEYGKIPLLEALDPSAGLDYLADNAAVNPFLFNQFGVQSTSPHNTESRQITVHPLQSLLTDAIKAGHQIVRLEGVTAFNNSTPQAVSPVTTSMVFRMFSNDQIHIESFGGSSAVNLLSRFADYNREIQEVQREIMQEEIRLVGEAVIAEVYHHDHPAAANISGGTKPRAAHLNYLNVASDVDSTPIPLSSLLLSIQQDKFVLQKKDSNQVVIPSISSAYNYEKSHSPLMRFLGDLQGQGSASAVRFSPETLVPFQRFYPRVQFRNVIFSLARWEIRLMELVGDAHRADPETLHRYIRNLYAGDWITIVDKDYDLLLHINRPESKGTTLLLDMLHRSKVVWIQEAPIDIEHTIIEDEHGRKYHHQLVALLHRQDPITNIEPLKILPDNDIQRVFLPGSQWLYIKLYCSPHAADLVLSQLVAPLAEKLQQQELVEDTFFLRYQDPDFHLRIRFRLRAEDWSLVMSRILAAARGIIYIEKIQIDSYEREIHRYGQVMLQSEKLFANETHGILTMLKAGLLETEESRIAFAAQVMRGYCGSLGLRPSEILQYLTINKRRLEGQFGITTDQRKRSSGYFRRHSTITKTSGGKLEQKVAASMCKQLYSQIWSVVTDRETRMQLLSHYMHMFVNRLFVSDQPIFEWVMYDQLFLFYRSDLHTVRSKRTAPERVL